MATGPLELCGPVVVTRVVASTFTQDVYKRQPVQMAYAASKEARARSTGEYTSVPAISPSAMDCLPAGEPSKP